MKVENKVVNESLHMAKERWNKKRRTPVKQRKESRFFNQPTKPFKSKKVFQANEKDEKK